VVTVTRDATLSLVGLQALKGEEKIAYEGVVVRGETKGLCFDRAPSARALSYLLCSSVCDDGKQ